MGPVGNQRKCRGPAGAGMGFSRYLRVEAGTPLQAGHAGPATFPGMLLGSNGDMHLVTENFGDRKHCQELPQLGNGVKGLTGRQGGHRTAVDEDPLPRAHMHTHTHACTHVLTRARAHTHTRTLRPVWATGVKAHRRAEHRCVMEKGEREGESSEWLISQPHLPKLSL